MQLIKLQDAFAQLEVAVEERYTLADGFNKVVVHTHWNVISREGTFTAGTIFVLHCVKNVSFHLRRQRRCNSIALLQERPM